MNDRKQRGNGQIKHRKGLDIYLYFDGCKAGAAKKQDHAKAGEIEEENEQSRRKNRWSQKRKSDLPKGFPAISAQHTSGFVQARIKAREEELDKNRSAATESEARFRTELRDREEALKKLNSRLEESESSQLKLEEKINEMTENEKNLREQMQEKQHELTEMKKELFMAGSESEELARRNEERIDRLAEDLQGGRRQIEQLQQQTSAG